LPHTGNDAIPQIQGPRLRSLPLYTKFNLTDDGYGESAGTFVLTVKTQLLEMVYFWKFDTKFDFKLIELVQ
jgi:hypothetical protein